MIVFVFFGVEVQINLVEFSLFQIQRPLWLIFHLDSFTKELVQIILKICIAKVATNIGILSTFLTHKRLVFHRFVAVVIVVVLASIRLL